MNVKIRNIEIQSANSVEDNKFFIELFEKQGKDIKKLLEVHGRDKRKMIQDSSDTTVTLGVKASLKVMKNSGLKGSDIDMIIFSSQFPEYTMPTQAMIVHNAIQGKAEAMVMDSNVNCVGMIVALDNAARYLLQRKDFKRALVVGSDYATIHCKKDDELTYPMFGDCACAMILEKTEEDCGIIGSEYYTNSDKYNLVKYPACGSASLYNNDINENDKKILWTPFDGSFIIKHAKKSVDKLLEENNLKISDIKAFCFSQFALPIINGCIKEFNVDTNKFIYIGDKYGYTGTSSPFITLYEAIEDGKVKRGDYVVFWSVGTNWTTCAVLLKY